MSYPDRPLVSESSGAVINPEAFYDWIGIHSILGISDTTLAKARKKKSLRYVRVGNQTLYQGCWIIDWLVTEGLE